MVIHFAIIGRKGATPDEKDLEILAEYPSNEAQLAETCRKIIASVNLADQRQSFKKDRYNYHTKISGREVYICVADQEYPMRICYALLNDMETKVKANDKKLKNSLKERMTYYNDTRNDKVLKVQEQIDEVKDIVMDNIDKVIARGEKLEVINAKAQDLEDASRDFHRTAVKVKRNMCAQNIKLILIIMAIIMGIAAVGGIILISVLCGTLDCNV